MSCPVEAICERSAHVLRAMLNLSHDEPLPEPVVRMFIDLKQVSDRVSLGRPQPWILALIAAPFVDYQPETDADTAAEAAASETEFAGFEDNDGRIDAI